MQHFILSPAYALSGSLPPVYKGGLSRLPADRRPTADREATRRKFGNQETKKLSEKMEVFKTIVCCALICVVITDVILAAPLALSRSELAAIEDTVVQDVERRLARDERRRSRRRRHTMPRDFAAMEYCIIRPHKCREYMARQRRRNQRRVVIIQK